MQNSAVLCSCLDVAVGDEKLCTDGKAWKLPAECEVLSQSVSKFDLVICSSSPSPTFISCCPVFVRCGHCFNAWLKVFFCCFHVAFSVCCFSTPVFFSYLSYETFVVSTFASFAYVLIICKESSCPYFCLSLLDSTAELTARLNLQHGDYSACCAECLIGHNGIHRQ